MDIQGTFSAIEADNSRPTINEVKWVKSNLRMPTLGQLLEAQFKDRQHLLYPWLREEESCMVYAATGVGKSLFALSVALAVAGGGEFLGWKVDEKASGEGWKVLYLDGEMHVGDIQERAKALIPAIPGIDKDQALTNLSFLPRQYQKPGTEFPLITEDDGMKFIREQVREGKVDLIILDNFSTLGEVEDENAAVSFNGIQQFLLTLKMERVATILVHHAGKNGAFRGSSKLAATFETIIELQKSEEKVIQGQAQFRVKWNKVRGGGPNKVVREVIAALIEDKRTLGDQMWLYEASALDRLDDMKKRMQESEFRTRKEMADFYEVSPTTITNWIEHGVGLGMWTDQEVGQWLANGKRARTLGKTEEPVRPMTDWRCDPDEWTNNRPDF